MFPFLSHNYHETIVDFGQGNRLKKDGWIAADLHVHSSCSKDVLHSPEFHPEAIYQRARQMGMG
ncbi:hypothetical protein GF373_01900, partial [bacterium]|nr:hypothetical protein [bacterium]